MSDDETTTEEPRERPASTARPVHPEQGDAERARGVAGRRRTVPGLLHSDDADEAEEPAEAPEPKAKSKAKK